MRSLVLVAAACGAPPPAAPPPQKPAPPSKWSAMVAEKCARHDESPFGSPGDYTTPVLSGFAVWEPRICDNQDAYIRVERLEGKRRLGTRRGPRGSGFVEGCMTAPASSAECPVVNFSVPGNEARIELDRRDAHAGGPGLGACGNFRGDYPDWNMSVSVMSWADADAAVRAVATALERYDLVGYLGVTVKGPTCGVVAL